MENTYTVMGTKESNDFLLEWTDDFVNLDQMLHADVNGRTPLMNEILAKNNQKSIELISSGDVDINSIDDEGSTALMYAILEDNVEIVRALLNTPTEIDYVSTFSFNGLNGCTPLMLAATKGNIQIVDALLRADANVNATNVYGHSALFSAVLHENKDIIDLLIESGADVNKSCKYRNISGYTPLILAAEQGNIGIVRTLMKAGADVHKSNRYRRTALFVALDKNYEDIFKLLVENGAEVNISCIYGKCSGYTPLMLATQRGNVEVVRILLSFVNVSSIDRGAALCMAVNANNQEIAQLLIDNGADVNVPCNYGKFIGLTPLMIAATNGNIAMVKLLLHANADVNKSKQHGETSLILAVIEDHKDIAKLLIESGANVNVFCRYNRFNEYTPLMCAIMNGNVEICKALIEATANVNAYDAYWNKTALMCAAIDGDKEIAKTLIQANANVSASDIFGRNALMFAATSGNEMIVEALLEANADINALANDGENALMCAASNGNITSLMVLLQNNANLDVTSEDGNTALMLASRNGHTEAVRVLLEAGAKVNICNQFSFNTLMFAAENGNTDIVKELLRANAKVNASYERGITALMCAASSGNLKTVVELLKANAKVNASDQYGKTPLMYAAKGENTAIVSALLQANANVNVRAKNKFENGVTALFLAVHNKNQEIAELLIDNGADVNISCTDGWTPLFSAVLFGRLELVSLLLANGATANNVDSSGRTLLRICLENETVYDHAEDYEVTQLMKESTLRELVKVCKNVNAKDNSGYTALHYAVRNEWEGAVQILIDAGADVNIRNNRGETPIFYTGNHDDIRVISLLLHAGANVNERDSSQETALFWAVQCSSHEIAETLIRANADLNARNDTGRAPIYYVLTNRYRCSKSTLFLQTNGAKLDVEALNDQSKLAHYIDGLCSMDLAKEQTIQTMDWFVECIQMNTVFTALIDMLYASILRTLHHNDRWSSEVYFANGMMLAKRYADNDHQKETVEKFCNLFKFERQTDNVLEMLDILIELGANPNSADSLGNTALHHAAQLPYFDSSYECTRKILDMLEKHGARYDIRNIENCTPILYGLLVWERKFPVYETTAWSRLETTIDICHYMLRHNPRVNETLPNGQSVFHIVLSIFHRVLFYLYDSPGNKEPVSRIIPDFLKLLKQFAPPDIVYGETVNKQHTDQSKSWSPLHIWASLVLVSNARSCMYTENIIEDLTFESILREVFDHLCVCGVDLNVRDKDGQTPLHCCNTWSAVKILVEAGAERSVIDSEGRTPLLAARRSISYLLRDFTEEPKSFFRKCVEMGFDLWTQDNNGETILSWLFNETDAPLLTEALVEVACESKQSVLEQLLLAVCDKQHCHYNLKSVLVNRILSCPMRPQMDLNPALRSCCLHIKTLYDRGLIQFEKENAIRDKPIFDVQDPLVYLDIARQLLSHGANAQYCEDLCTDFDELKTFLTE